MCTFTEGYNRWFPLQMVIVHRFLYAYQRVITIWYDDDDDDDGDDDDDDDDVVCIHVCDTWS